MADPLPNRIPMGAADFYWSFDPSFGPYLRKLRNEKGLSLRAAAQEIGLSFTKLQKLETGGRSKPPSLQLLDRLAKIYDQPQEDFLRKAGVVIDMPPDFYDRMNNRKAFEGLVLHPALKPFKMTPDWVESFSERQRQQWIEFALKLEDHIQKGGESLTDIMEDAVVAEDHSS